MVLYVFCEFSTRVRFSTVLHGFVFALVACTSFYDSCAYTLTTSVHRPQGIKDAYNDVLKELEKFTTEQAVSATGKTPKEDCGGRRQGYCGDIAGREAR